MKIWRTIREVERWWDAGFVPTMGAFHEGHLELMRRAKSECGRCVVSLFVNPTQFGPNEDFSRYPRVEEQDIELAKSVGVDAIFIPTVEEMYGPETVEIHVGKIAEVWDGYYRPRHFLGVATVVNKLFNIVGTGKAYFGLKDFQQCAVLQQMVRGLNMPIELRFVETIRENDGLALSSRNRYLSPELRSIAPNLYLEISRVSSAIKAGASVEATLEEAKKRLEQLGFKPQYVAYVNARTLEPLSAYSEDSRVLAAAYLGDTRLIDNVA